MAPATEALQPSKSLRWLMKVPYDPTQTQRNYYPSFLSPEEGGQSPRKQGDPFPGQVCSKSVSRGVVYSLTRQ